MAGKGIQVAGEGIQGDFEGIRISVRVFSVLAMDQDAFLTFRMQAKVGESSLIIILLLLKKGASSTGC